MTKKYINLYHYSTKDIDGALSASHFGDNYFTANDKNVSSVNRLFFYDVPVPENLLRNSNYLYTCRINTAHIYDLRTDEKKLVNKYNGNITLILRRIKRDFKGIIYRIGNYNIICLFNSIVPLKKEKLS